MKATAPIQRKLAAHGLKPAEHYLDSGYPSADLITKALKQDIRMVTPVLLDRSAQAKAAEGFDKNAFTINWKTCQVRCSAGRTSSYWNPVKQHGTGAVVITFGILTCRECPFQQQCTISRTGRRTLTLRPEELHRTRPARRIRNQLLPHHHETPGHNHNLRSLPNPGRFNRAAHSKANWCWAEALSNNQTTVSSS